jgi:hypothetical protein
MRSTRKTLRADLAAAVRAATDHEFSEQQWLMKTDDFKEGVKSVSERRVGGLQGALVRASAASSFETRRFGLLRMRAKPLRRVHLEHHLVTRKSGRP